MAKTNNSRGASASAVAAFVASNPNSRTAQAAASNPTAPATSAKNSGGGNATNQAIQRQLGSVGQGVNYMEASAIAQKLGVSVDRVYNQTAKTGQNAIAGGAAANAGYIPTSQLKVSSPITAGYAQQAAANAQAQLAAANAAPAGDGSQAPVVPEFDWNAWNAQMMAQQAAIWESMDAMNAEFMQRQQDWLSQMDKTPQTQVRNSILGGSLPADKAAIKRQKRTRQSSTTKTGLNTSPASGGLSLGGQASAGGLSIGKG